MSTINLNSTIIIHLFCLFSFIYIVNLWWSISLVCKYSILNTVIIIHLFCLFSFIYIVNLWWWISPVCKYSILNTVIIIHLFCLFSFIYIEFVMMYFPKSVSIIKLNNNSDNYSSILCFMYCESVMMMNFPSLWVLSIYIQS